MAFMPAKRSTKGKLSQLIEAVSADDLKKVDALLAEGVEADARDDRGLTPLMHAARATGHPRIVKRLLDAGADPAATDDHGWSALRYAQRREPSKAQQAIVAMLGGKAPAGKGSNKKNRKTPAGSRGTSKGLGRRIVERIAAEVKEWGPGKWVLHVGVPLILPTAFTILSVLAGTYKLPNVRYLLGFTFFLCLAVAIIWFLADVDASDADRDLSRAFSEVGDEPGLPRLMAAIAKGVSPEKMSSLIKTGADINEREGDQGKTALIWAAIISDQPALFRVLLDAGARVNDVDKEGSTALMLAADVNENPEVVRVLLEAGADVNAVGKGGKSALDLALERSKKDKGREKIVKLLENAGARVHGGRKKR